VEKKSYAKVNIFLKIVGKRGDYHLIASRFATVYNLFDVIKFQSGKFGEFTLEGDFGCETTKNTIYKAYLNMVEVSSKVEFFFKSHKVVVDKRIPEFAGLGGGSSNAATFILMVNEFCNLNLSKNEMSNVASKIGADVPFFIYQCSSANVSGIGEVVEPFEEEILDIQTFTPNIKCDTGAIFREFRENFYKECSRDEVLRLFTKNSKDIFKTLDIGDANDLYFPASKVYPSLKEFENNRCFSGSGSSFFEIICEKK